MSAVTKLGALAATAALSMTLVACGGSPGSGGNGNSRDTAQSLAAQTQYNPQAYDNLRDGGTLTTAQPEISPQWNIFQGNTTAYSQAVWNWYNPILTTSSPDGKPAFNPDYLTDVKADTVSGNTRITYTINPKATYNDGSPIDWTAFEATWKANNAQNKAYIVNSSDGYDRIASVTRGVDDRQAIVTFNGANVWWQALFGSLLNPKALDPQVFNQGYVDNPHPEWGAGPYTVQKFDKQNGTVIFTRNPKWWGKKGKLDARTFLAMEDVASINAFRNGQLDSAPVGTKDRLAQVQGMTGIDIRKGISLHNDLFTLNSKSPILADPQIRKAVLEGIDRKQIADITFQGLNFTETLPGSLTLFSFQDGYQDNFSKVITFDANKAKQDLEAAGWRAGPDGMRSKNGQPLEFSYVNTGDDPVGKAIAGAVVAMLKNIGIKLDIQQVASRDFSTIISGRKFDIFYSGFLQSDPFGMAYICQLYCSDSQLNLSGTNNPAFDSQVKAVNTLATAQEQFAKGNEVETEAFKTYGLMPTLTLPAIIAVKHGLANYGSGRFFSTTPENIGWQK
ncbi:MAG: ABC transporter family substrate-binding protein [Pseudonocardiales bacterium]|nr:ABC transporter family substrate-binding protein [Pseudonocardiales bacterium]MBV9650769.1 ABC transporter family substrate-binding protein [Pseudonocardiales bacterium]